MLIANGPNLDHEVRRDSGEGTLKYAKMTLTIFRELFRFQSGIKYSLGYLFFHRLKFSDRNCPAVFNPL